MLIVTFEIICAIFTVYGMYTFIHDMVDLMVVAVRRHELKKLEKEKRKESTHDADPKGHGDG